MQQPTREQIWRYEDNKRRKPYKKMPIGTQPKKDYARPYTMVEKRGILKKSDTLNAAAAETPELAKTSSQNRGKHKTPPTKTNEQGAHQTWERCITPKEA